MRYIILAGKTTSQKFNMDLHVNDVVVMLSPLSCFYAFWCFLQLILAIFHIANVFVGLIIL